MLVFFYIWLSAQSPVPSNMISVLSLPAAYNAVDIIASVVDKDDSIKSITYKCGVYGDHVIWLADKKKYQKDKDFDITLKITENRDQVRCIVSADGANNGDGIGIVVLPKTVLTDKKDVEL